MMSDNTFKQLDRNAVTEATLLDIDLDACHDPQDYNDLLKEYYDFVIDYDLFEKPYVEDASLGYPEEPQWEELIFEENGKYGINESYFNKPVPAIYDKIICIDESNEYLVTKNGKKGIIWIDDNIHEFIKPEYDFITYVRHSQYIVEKDEKKFYINDGRITSTCYDEIRVPQLTGWIHVKQKDIWGYLDVNLDFTLQESEAHEFVIPDCFDRHSRLQELGISIYEATRNSISECDKIESNILKSGKESSEWQEYEKKALPLCYDYHYQITEGNGKYGVKDFLDCEIIMPEYDEIRIVGEHLPSIFGRKNGKWSLLLQSGSFSNLYFYSDTEPEFIVFGNCVKAKIKGKYGVYDPDDGKWYLPPIYDELIPDNDRYCIITRIADKYGFFNVEFNVPAGYDKILLGRCFAFVRFVKDGDIGYIDCNGKWTANIKEARVFSKDPMYCYK